MESLLRMSDTCEEGSKRATMMYLSRNDHQSRLSELESMQPVVMVMIRK